MSASDGYIDALSHKHLSYLLPCFFLMVIVVAYHAPISSYPQISLLPPALAISSALITRRVILSLLLGVIAGGFLTTNPFSSVLTLTSTGIIHSADFILNSLTTAWNIQVLVFLLAILCAISVMILSGGLKGVIAWLAPYARSGRSAQLIAYVMGLLMFIDDYANAALVGSSMRPIFDDYKISREKLAFIVDSTSAPISGVAFVSTWIGYEVGQIGQVAQQLQLPIDGYGVFFDIFCYRFYCIFMLVFVLCNILSGKDFGLMRRMQAKHEPEHIIASKEELMAAQPLANAQIHGMSAIIPISLMLVYFILGLWVDGGGMQLMQQSSWWQILNPNHWRNVVGHAAHNMQILMQAGVIALVSSLLCARLIAKLEFKQLLLAIRTGFITASLPLMILILAWSLKAACDALHTDTFLVGFLGGELNATLLPLVTFAMAALTAVATGTSWGTMAILLPMVIPLAVALDGGYGLVTMLSISAVLDGSIFGDHISPISDTTVMSSIASGCDHINHVLTQLPYAVIVATLAVGCGYWFVLLKLPLWLSYASASLIIIGLFWMLHQPDHHHSQA